VGLSQPVRNELLSATNVDSGAKILSTSTEELQDA